MKTLHQADGVRIGRFGGEGTGGQSFFKAGELGFEPRLKESESFVLPLHHSPVNSSPEAAKGAIAIVSSRHREDAGLAAA